MIIIFLLGFLIQKQKLDENDIDDYKKERFNASNRDQRGENKKENQSENLESSKKGKSILKGDKRKTKAEEREGDRTTQTTKTKGKILEEDQDTIEKSNKKGRGKVIYGENSGENSQFSILGETIF